MSQWEERAATAIALAIAQAQQNGFDARATVKLIDKAYPFGPRAHHPYKVWLAVRARALASLEVRPGEETVRPCGACGAPSLSPCRPIGDEQLTGSHASRMEPNR